MKSRNIFVIAVILVFLSHAGLWAADWKFYGWTGNHSLDSTVNVYIRSESLVSKDKAAFSHYYERESVLHISKDIVRVWEKSVTLGETESLKKLVKDRDKRIQDIESQEISGLAKDLAIQMSNGLPAGRATKESMTLYEINCSRREYRELEYNSYDKEGVQISFDTYNHKFSNIMPGSFIEGLYRCVCK